ncbi:gluconate 2-dehydrogenase subunit 3 family protein [Aliikangiella coralliicola]|uniref:Twin-arginine translocation signal domain-containing protein n=1 Tax=Aliikangiella coralliicola TaxID=2592383 RepID=A0A545U7S8_9GAMM|nr:gluconate 2-dehydrogenase subunit 3 family protein [Aliikangiella coralliicola]TQV85530.1 twin-arginine translocation signal domain-containing protein [Aliikangiella coralliicola]
MLKSATSSRDQKRGSGKHNKPEALSETLSNGLNRRAFLKTSATTSLLAALAACKPSVPTSDETVLSESKKAVAKSTSNKTTSVFNEHQKTVIDSVQMHLFPEDGDGPNARDINALAYLEFAMTDKKNIDDGDPEFLAKGVGWLEDLSEQTQGDSFLKITTAKQEQILKQIAGSEAGENWLSLLVYYLTEALLLDPVYGGNTDTIGWQWLKHQPGFPRPVAGKTYRDFD